MHPVYATQMVDNNTQDYTDIQAAIPFLSCFTKASQITEASEGPEAPALLPVFLITLIICNAQR